MVFRNIYIDRHDSIDNAHLRDEVIKIHLCVDVFFVTSPLQVDFWTVRLMRSLRYTRVLMFFCVCVCVCVTRLITGGLLDSQTDEVIKIHPCVDVFCDQPITGDLLKKSD